MVLQSYGGRELASLEELRGSWGADGQGVTVREDSEWLGVCQHSCPYTSWSLSRVAMGGSHWRILSRDVISDLYFEKNMLAAWWRVSGSEREGEEKVKLSIGDEICFLVLLF